jgi:hypothetical protein
MKYHVSKPVLLRVDLLGLGPHGVGDHLRDGGQGWHPVDLPEGATTRRPRGPPRFATFSRRLRQGGGPGGGGRAAALSTGRGTSLAAIQQSNWASTSGDGNGQAGGMRPTWEVRQPIFGNMLGPRGWLSFFGGGRA